MFRNSIEDVRFDLSVAQLPEDTIDDDPLADENERLLEKKSESVAINRVGISDIHTHRKLHNEIKRVIHILDESQHSMAGVKTENSHRYYKQVALCIGAGLLAVTAPSLFTGLMWGQIIRSVENVAGDLVAEITKFAEAVAACKSSADIQEKLLMANASSLHEILKPVLEKWWNFSPNGEDCLGFTSENDDFIHEVIATPNSYEFRNGYWCNDAIGYGRFGDPVICHAAVKEGCSLITQHAGEAATILQQFRDLEDKNRICTGWENKLSDLKFNLSKIGFTDRIDLTNALIAGGITVGAAVIIGLLFWARSRSKNEMMHRNNDANKFVSMIHNVEDANAIINSCARLNIPFDPDMSISSLLQIYIGLNSQIEALWKRRIAFLSGAKDQKSDLFGFFKSGGKGPAQIILHHAGLGPQSIRK